MLHIFLVLSWSGTNFNIFEFLFIAPILFFGDSLSSVLYSLPRILWLLIQKKLKTTALTRLKIETIFLYLDKKALLAWEKIETVFLELDKKTFTNSY